MGPAALSQVLRQLTLPRHPALLVDIDTADDAGVYKLNDTTALVQTVDFFSPIVDDPYTFGQIAAANSLSDIYAMGARPLTALNIVAFPICSLGTPVLQAILQGGADKVAEAEAVILGGHSVDDKEPKYGLAVTGVVHPDRLLTNAGARPGDVLVLTKPLGTGILATAARAELFADAMAEATHCMATLNRAAARVLAEFPVSACTDITGFGLAGHVYEMAAASGVAAVLDSVAIPLLPEVLAAASMGFVPAGAYANRDYLGSRLTFAAAVSDAWRDVCCDPQTSGGLLAALPAEAAADAVAALRAAGVTAAVIGEITSGEGTIYVR